MKKLTSLCWAGLFLSQASSATEISGNLGIDTRLFHQEALDLRQSDNHLAIHAEVELYWPVGDAGNQLIFKPYVRLDSEDKERHLFDIRELMYLHLGDDWEFKLGVGKVFWGVTESLHLVDVINQTDTLASFDGEEKLGQPMVHFSLIKDWGVLDLFALVGFRERDFAGESGRLRPLIPIAAEASYQSDQEWQHIDFAARWSNSIDDWEVGVSVFSGTSREPEFRPQYNIDTQQFELQAYYGLINQLGIDVQYIYEDWLWKLEAISRHSNTMQDQNALVGGFEYSVIGIADTAIDLGLVLEYGYDDREQGAPIQNDLSFATRWAFNDAESSEILIGINTDLDYSGSQSAFIEGSTRIGESTVVTLDAWFFRADEPDDISYGFRRDDFIQLDVSYYF